MPSIPNAPGDSTGRIWFLQELQVMDEKLQVYQFVIVHATYFWPDDTQDALRLFFENGNHKLKK